MKSEMYESGLAMRKKVLGAEYVDNNFRNADELTLPFQELLTEFAWGGVWTRPGLSLRERSMLTVVICVALNRPAELRIHLRGAIRNGCTRTEVREMLMHAFIYCGGPAAVDAFKIVKECWSEIEAEAAGE